MQRPLCAAVCFESYCMQYQGACPQLPTLHCGLSGMFTRPGRQLCALLCSVLCWPYFYCPVARQTPNDAPTGAAMICYKAFVWCPGPWQAFADATAPWQAYLIRPQFEANASCGPFSWGCKLTPLMLCRPSSLMHSCHQVLWLPTKYACVSLNVSCLLLKGLWK